MYSWDNNGNLFDDGSRTFTYDTANRLTSVTEGSNTTTFTYNGDGDRYSQTIGGVTTDYVLDPVGLAQVLVETTSGQSNFYVPGLAQYGNEWQYFATDRLGNTRQLADPVGEVLRSQTFDPFGNVLEQGGTGQSIFGYTGEQTDPTDLVFLRARYYDPRVGRFLTADSIIPDPMRSVGWNRYAYVENNPIRYIDPSGHCLFSFIGPDIAQSILDCIETINSTLEANPSEEDIGKLIQDGLVIDAKHFLISQAETLHQLNTDADVVFSNACFEDRITPSIRLGLWATGEAALIVGAGQGVRGAREISFGKNFRIAPLGNKTGHPIGRFPHYHRRGVDPITKQTYPGQGIGRHRPWETKSTDTSFWDKF